jgi:hypothetical protein
MPDTKDILSENGISHEGMSLLEVIAAYPEQALALLRANVRVKKSELLRGAIELIRGYQEIPHSNNSAGSVEELIKHLEEKVVEIDDSDCKNLENVLFAIEGSNLESQTDYGKAKIRVSSLPKITLGQEINTPLGKGIVISLSMPSNGLYLSPEKAEVTVWFSTMQFQHGWVQYSYSYNDLKDYI